MVMSGGNFATSLLQAGVIDEIGLNIHPVLLGAGTPAFLDPGARVNLELTECRQLDWRLCVRPLWRQAVTTIVTRFELPDRRRASTLPPKRSTHRLPTSASAALAIIM